MRPVADNHGFLGNLGITIQVIRMMKGLSQAEPARRAGIRPNQVSRYETGQVLPQLGQLAKLLDALEIDFADLVQIMRMLRWIEGLVAVAQGVEPFHQITEGLVADLFGRQIEEVERVRDALIELEREEK